MFAFFLTSGLFLGWTLGANDASNVFGTAVGSRMIRFRTAAGCCAVFILLGAVISGAGASETLGRLGEVNAVAGAFMVALAAGASVYLMTKFGYPVSTSMTLTSNNSVFSRSFLKNGVVSRQSWLLRPERIRALRAPSRKNSSRDFAKLPAQMRPAPIRAAKRNREIEKDFIAFPRPH